ncbi:unnamed protein product [Leptidea sinapis]|uniref:Uncharacterized protein n=1 Tax=Leptidea sinapis TaxID=189913 RepID=A0A5E4QKL0_9NEOP|nr:unnamed protein product [Leptidea sinapis]
MMTSSRGAAARLYRYGYDTSSYILYTPLQVQNYNEVRLALREQLSQAIQCASYILLRDMEHCLKWSNIKLASYQRSFNGLRLNIWVAIPLPTRKPRPIEPESRSNIPLSSR